MKSSFFSSKILVLLVLVGSGILLLSSARTEKTTTRIQSKHDLTQYRGGGGSGAELPVIYNSLFAGSGACGGCHGSDPDGVASITGEGTDINITDDWRSTMMANAVRDPFWKAKVSHEVAVNPQHQVALETKCTSCHAPAGHFAAIHDGAEFYSMEMLANDTLGQDGVNCVACHQQDPRGIGSRFSGDLTFVEDTVYGPFDGNVFGPPMISFVGYEPLYGDHVDKSESCAACHSLLTNTADLEGELTGTQFVEQATYHEWLNSVYSVEGSSTECQDCHMPSIDEPIVISSGYAFLPGRQPFSQHHLVGGNSFMLELMKNRIVELGIPATEEQFDRTIERTLDLLQNRSVIMNITEAEIVDDSLQVVVDLTNITGHKFPSGYPARRAFIEFVVTDENEDVVFSSGTIQEDYEVQGQNADYEPHYDKITSEDQVQIYELVFGDVNGDVSTILERANDNIKDNRLVPIGFTNTHITYDTTKVSGLALDDLNFNLDDEGNQGTGADKIVYKIGLEGLEGQLNVAVNFYYQSTPPKWMDEMFSVSTPEIDSFKQMYDDEGADPVLIASEETGIFYVGVENTDWTLSTRIYPNPMSKDGLVWLRTPDQVKLQYIRVYDMKGRLVLDLQNPTSNPQQLQWNGNAGTYLIEAVAQDGKRFIERVIK